MKEIRKYLVLVLVLAASLMMVGCGKKDKSLAEKVKDGEKIKIGILQYVTHDSLGQAKEGFLEALEGEGYKEGKEYEVKFYNPEGDESASGTMATNIVRECDLGFAIATPSATALQHAAVKEESSMPMLFTAVTDPVSASLVESNENPGKNASGTNDMNPIEAQVKLLKEIKPDLKKIGIIYNITEPNSIVQADKAKKVCKKEGIECIVGEVPNEVGQIPAVTNKLINDGAEAIYVPTDNLMASNMQAIVNVSNPKKVMTSCGADAMVTDGGSISYSIDYKQLGYQTGLMAVKLFKGEDVNKMAVESQDKARLKLVVNEEAFTAMGIELPQSIKDRIGK